MSTKIGLAPAWTMALAVAMNERLGHSTSSPGLMPAAKKAKCRAVVQDETATAWAAPTYSANLRSNSATQGPWLTQPLLSTSRTAFSSFSPKDGRAMGMVFNGIVELMTPPQQVLDASARSQRCAPRDTRVAMTNR